MTKREQAETIANLTRKISDRNKELDDCKMANQEWIECLKERENTLLKIASEIKVPWDTDAQSSELFDHVCDVISSESDLRAEVERLKVQRDCAVASLQLCPQAPAGHWASFEFLPAYRKWWVKRLVGTDAALSPAQPKPKALSLSSCLVCDGSVGACDCAPEASDADRAEAERMASHDVDGCDDPACQVCNGLPEKGTNA